MNCQFCSATNPPDALFCTECGHTLASAPIPTTTITLDDTVCPICGQTIPKGELLCPTCHPEPAPLQSQTITNNEQPASLSQGGIWRPEYNWLIILILGVVSLLIFPTRWPFVVIGTGVVGLFWLFFQRFPLPALILLAGVVSIAATVITHLPIFPVIAILAVILWFVVRR